ncbi:ABC transporter ATP-binding protein [Falsihalocynthiibacter arcticus]|uniref:Iron ABC transporter n=1 Tax=Falsihalocynthiibacter arcticus TaxID=1579316 RepID=A0A126V3B4_9RHOB|nr:ATP-binding cassette domain-containing protein [Falsihalocynthiibacter arcticus]AML52366.1 iron ABC transporter [Falsihalocynthiibacter arcticus]
MTIKLQNLRAGYRGFMLKDINQDLPKGRLTALIGPNGCGKSTLFGAMAGNLAVKSGRILIDGLDVTKTSPRKISRHVALLPQNPVVPPAIRVEQLVAYGRAPYQNLLGQRRAGDQEAIESAMVKAGIDTLRQSKLSDLSGGQRQRAFLAMCLAQDTPVMLFDEPTSFLDIRYQYETLEVLADLANGGRTVVVVLHDIGQAARFAHHLVVMKAGKVINSGRPSETITPQTLRDAYEVEAQVYADPVTQTPQLSPLSSVRARN